VEGRARWVLDSIGGREVGFGDDVKYRAEAWEQVERGERPTGDDLAEAFFHLARIEERDAGRDEHDRFRASSSSLDPLDPPVERLRRTLKLEPPRWGGARFAVALTHDVDTPWKWTRMGVRGGAARLKQEVLGRRTGAVLREARALAGVPMHLLRRTDPYWSFERILADERRAGASSTFFLMAQHAHPNDGLAGESYRRLRPRIVEALLEGGAEVGLHGSYSSADRADRLEDEKQILEALAGPVRGQRYHYLRLDPHSNFATLDSLGFLYDSTLGFADQPGFRAGIAQPFRPWDLDREQPLRLVEIPLAAMDVTLAEERYLNLSARDAAAHLGALVDWAAEHGGGFSVIWHSEQWDSAAHPGWDRLYRRFMEYVRARGGVCVSAGELAEEANAWLP
jgi:peptidoglycan/xylan/chitin deacetylase (PgdA/CDA1 family)